ncbi:hypothetical protein ARMSODRAFT_983100 [Armillaria solidipes]|uniref:Uncharacterized protein n=1 Tax=Armillaria solidipes TaxID=1076256 RepID=A0A2H3AWX8_9AGAR|nr:hypothetical protein ARMSODRAFT_983100 [Armillaria solidipes]
MQYVCGRYLHKETKDTVDEETSGIATALRGLCSVANTELDSKTELGFLQDEYSRSVAVTVKVEVKQWKRERKCVSGDIPSHNCRGSHEDQCPVDLICLERHFRERNATFGILLCHVLDVPRVGVEKWCPYAVSSIVEHDAERRTIEACADLSVLYKEMGN